MATKSVNLKVDWATYEAARYACRHWHYSHSMPAGKSVKIGAWEDGRFIGVIIFSRGANNNIGRPYGLTQDQCCELTRIAMREHVTPISKILSIALKMLRSQSPGIRLVVSYADTAQGHHGGVYQASNWIYVGEIVQPSLAITRDGRIAHKRTLDSAGITDYILLPARAKHKYLYPMDEKMRKQIAPLSKRYPKRKEIDVHQKHAE